MIVLVADDEFAVLELLAMALEAEGHRVLKASSAAEAQQLLAMEACDVIVCDERIAVTSERPMIVMAHAALPARPGVVVLVKPILLTRLFEEVRNARRGP